MAYDLKFSDNWIKSRARLLAGVFRHVEYEDACQDLAVLFLETKFASPSVVWLRALQIENRKAAATFENLAVPVLDHADPSTPYDLADWLGSVLDESQYRIAIMLVEGYTQEEIGKAFSYSQQAAALHCETIRTILEKATL